MSCDNSKFCGMFFLQKMSPVKTLLKYLDKVYGAVGDYIEDDSGYAKCLFFQDASMKDVFNFYPDRICMYRIFANFKIELNLYLFLCEDSNGRNYIISVGFLQNNDHRSLTWLFNHFKRHNPNWKKIKSIVLDPDMDCFELVRDLFPTHVITICFFHVCELFKKFIATSEKLKTISESQKSYAVDLFKGLFYASKKSEYEYYREKFDALPETIVSYLNEVWLPTQQDWRIPLDYAHEDVFKNLNLYLEELNHAIKSLLQTEKNYIEFIKKLFLVILLKKREKPNMFLQPVSFLYSRYSPEFQISKALTPYAAKFVIEQLDMSSEFNSASSSLLGNYTFDYLSMEVSASSANCTCNFFIFTSLPCRHIFAARKFNYLCVFEESNVDYTWNMKYYQHALACLQDYLVHCTESRIPQDCSSRLTLASHLFEIIVPPLLELPRENYDSHLQVIKQLLQIWKMNEHATIQFIGTETLEEKNKSCFLKSSTQSIFEKDEAFQSHLEDSTSEKERLSSFTAPEKLQQTDKSPLPCSVSLKKYPTNEIKLSQLTCLNLQKKSETVVPSCSVSPNIQMTPETESLPEELSSSSENSACSNVSLISVQRLNLVDANEHSKYFSLKYFFFIKV